MKKHRNNKRLSLNKTTIAILTRKEMRIIKGGGDPDIHHSADCDTSITVTANGGNMSD